VKSSKPRDKASVLWRLKEECSGVEPAKHLVVIRVEFLDVNVRPSITPDLGKYRWVEHSELRGHDSGLREQNFWKAVD